MVTAVRDRQGYEAPGKPEPEEKQKQMFYTPFTKADVPDVDIWHVADEGLTLDRVDRSGFIIHSDGVPEGSYDVWDNEDSGRVAGPFPTVAEAMRASETRSKPERIGY